MATWLKFVHQSPIVNPFAPPPTAPTISTQPSAQSVTVPATATFTVVAAGSGTLTYAWEVDKGSGFAAVTGADGTGGTTASFTTVASVIGMNSYTYRVVVSNAGGNVTSNAVALTVGTTPPPAGPTISTQPTAQSVTVPATATFSVVATGTGALSYQWQVNAGGGTFVDVTGANGSGGTTASFTTVASIIGMNGYSYRVEVTDSNGTTVSNAVGLTVGAAPPSGPTISTQPTAQSVTVPATATFSVVATGTGTLSYQWQVDTGTGFADVTGADGSGGTTASFTTVASVVGMDGYDYQVIVTDDNGDTTSNAVGLTVSPAAPAGDYDFTTVGAGTPGNGISGYITPSGDFGEFYDNVNGGPQLYPGAEAMRALGGWVRWIHISPTGSPTADGLTVGTATTLDGFGNRVGTTFGPGDWGLLYDGTHNYFGSGSAGYTGSGTATNPIRLCAVNALGAKIVSAQGWDAIGWNGADYWGIHGVEIDASGCVWGANPGLRYDGDSRASCSNFDFWHCYIHSAYQEVFHYGSRSGDIPTNVHVHACEIANSGQNLMSGATNSWGPFSELMYFGNGASDPNDPVHNVTVDWSHIHGSPAGEGLDFKGGCNDVKILHNLIHDVRVASQGGVTFQSAGTSREIGYNIMYDIKEVPQGGAGIYGWSGSSPPYSAPVGWTNGWTFDDTYEGAIIIATGEMSIHHNVMWDCGDAAVVHYDRPAGSGLNIYNNTIGVLTRQDNAATSAAYEPSNSPGNSGTGSWGTVNFSNNLSIDLASGHATQADSSNFVNPVGTATSASRIGAGYQLAAGSPIAGTNGAMGKAA